MSNFKFNLAEITPQTPVDVAVESRLHDAGAKQEATTRRRAVPLRFNAYAAEAATIQPPRSRLCAEMPLLKVPRWMSGLWADRAGGWHDARTDLFLSFDDARGLIAARTVELGLTPEAIERWMRSSCGVVEEMVFQRLDFAEQMHQVLNYQES